MRKGGERGQEMWREERKWRERGASFHRPVWMVMSVLMSSVFAPATAIRGPCIPCTAVGCT